MFESFNGKREASFCEINFDILRVEMKLVFSRKIFLSLTRALNEWSNEKL